MNLENSSNCQCRIARKFAVDHKNPIFENQLKYDFISHPVSENPVIEKGFGKFSATSVSMTKAGRMFLCIC